MAKYITTRTGIRAANAYATSVFPSDRQPMAGTNAAASISKSATSVSKEGWEMVTPNNNPARANTNNERTAKMMALPMLAGPSPAVASFSAKYGPKMIGSHEMPTSAAPPPAAVENQGVGQCSSSPTSRRMVTASVITVGIAMSRV